MRRFYRSRSGFRDAPAFRFCCQHMPPHPPTTVLSAPSQHTTHWGTSPCSSAKPWTVFLRCLTSAFILSRHRKSKVLVILSFGRATTWSSYLAVKCQTAVPHHLPSPPGHPSYAPPSCQQSVELDLSHGKRSLGCLSANTGYSTLQYTPCVLCQAWISEGQQPRRVEKAPINPAPPMRLRTVLSADILSLASFWH